MIQPFLILHILLEATIVLLNFGVYDLYAGQSIFRSLYNFFIQALTSFPCHSF